MKYYNQCPNCGETAHVSGCVSDKCILDGLRSGIRIAEAHVLELKRKIAEVEARIQSKDSRSEART